MLELLQWLGFSVLTGVAISFGVRAKRDPMCEEEFEQHNLPASIACSGVAFVLVASLIENRLWVAFQTHLHQADGILKLATLASFTAVICLYLCTVVLLLPHLFVITLPRLRKRLTKKSDQRQSELACKPMSKRLLLWLLGLHSASLMAIVIIIKCGLKRHIGFIEIVFLCLGIVIGLSYPFFNHLVECIINRMWPKPVEEVAEKAHPLEFKTPIEIRIFELYRIFILILCLVGFCYFSLYRAIIEPLLQYFHVIAS